MSYIVQNEEKILAFWKKNKIFKKSLDKNRGKKQFTFYDGPPFATGLPHYGHLIGGILKDAVPRFWTMRGYYVPRRFGWDCHGLPVEYEMEKELGVSGKKEIEEKLGIGKFNESCRGIVLRYTAEWRKTVERSGRWVDMDNDYRTMDAPYMESIWWVFKTLYDKGLIYEGNKILPYCPRCATPLSNFEANMPGAYREITDEAATVKLKILNEDKTYLLIWTTTPWTLPSNSGAAVGADIDYVKILDKASKEIYILAKERLNAYYRAADEYKILEKIKGADLVDLRYEPVFPYFQSKDTEGAFRVVAGDFVTTTDGTGIVHIAPAFGEDDYALAKKEGLPFLSPVDDSGCFTESVGDYAGAQVRDANKEIIANLKSMGMLVKKENYEHPYPHCWRCDTPLIYKAVSTWFVQITKIKGEMIKQNKKIRWVPEHLMDGRFGLWLEGARDWAISRNRYWGTPLPVWVHTGKSQIPNPKSQKNSKSKIQNYKCSNVLVVGSKEELEKLSGKKVSDLHRHFIDEIEIKCPECGGTLRRVPEVLDCWFESGSMPYAQGHYPFENKKEFDANFPADFIAEGIDQTRGWFYTLLAISVALFGKTAFKNVVVNGLILAEDGKKMSKRLKNYPEPAAILNQYGADALRYYLITSPAARADELRFSEAGVAEVSRKLLMMLQNIFSFFSLYKAGLKPYKKLAPKNILNKWIVAKLKELEAAVRGEMENYDVVKAARPLADFVQDFSAWFLRRSRDKIKDGDAEALQTLHYVLLEFCKIAAPFIPFMAESLYRELGGLLESVHLEDWPKYRTLSDTEKNLLQEMQKAREVVEAALSIRREKGIKVRQPLSELRITNYELRKEIAEIVAEEINIKLVSVIPAKAGIPLGKEWAAKGNVALNTKITQELREEGAIREVVRAVNGLRKDAGLTPQDKITLYIDPSAEKLFGKFQDEISKSTVSGKIVFAKKDLPHAGEVKLDDRSVWVGVEKL